MRRSQLGFAALVGLYVFATCVLPPGERRRRPSSRIVNSAFRGVPNDGGAARAPVICASGSPDASTDHPSSDRLATRFAVIGDYGMSGPDERRVAALVASWHPDFVITLGDNNYPVGAFETIDDNIGQYYHELIGGYAGRYGCASATNRFFPSLGNHDWYTLGAEPYLDFFDLPGNERYYDTTQGNVHLFALDSDPSEPDGVGPDSVQATWLRGALAASTAPWRIVYMHHPPYSSGPHGSTVYMQWPYKEWGASLVLGGHDHIYQRLNQGGMTYVVNGLGGAEPYTVAAPPLAGTLSEFAAGFGALLVDADASQLRARFHTAGGELIDQFVLAAPSP